MSLNTIPVSHHHAVLKHSVALQLAVVLIALALTITVSIFTTPKILQLVFPTIAVITLFVLFSVMLQTRLGTSLFGEIGFIYLAWAVIYTVIPGFGLATESSTQIQPLEFLQPDSQDLANHLWRHVLFIGAIAIGYLVARGRTGFPKQLSLQGSKHSSNLMLSLLIGVIIANFAILLFLSSPVTNYYEHYNRYDHLPWFLRKVSSVLVRINIGLYPILLVLLFLNYKRYRILVPMVLIALCLFEITYSFGARILSLIILLQAAFLYHLLVRQVSLARALITCAILGIIFTGLEFFREVGFDFSLAQSRVSKDGLKVASEFSSVFFSGYHLYTERAQGSLPATEWPMFFNDFISIMTFGDFTQWNPMEWYARIYHPDALAAPTTLGPIANSAIWGGEFDLLARGLLNGVFFACIVRCFLKWCSRWWCLPLYVFCISFAIINLKYSIFYQLTPLVKTMLPALLVFAIIRWLSKIRFAAAK